MSTVAKVFVVLNLIFAVIYVGFSAALLSKQENWYHKYKDLDTTTLKTIGERDASIQKLQAEKTSAVAAEGTLRSENESLKTQMRDLTEVNKRVEKDNEDGKAELGKLREEYNVLFKDVNDQRAENERLTKDFNTVKDERDEAVKVRVQVQDDFQRFSKDNSDTKVILDDLEKRYVEVAKTNQENENIIATYLSKLKLRIDEAIMKTPAIQGKVVGVSDKYNLVMLNVGEHDQVKEGYEFTVYRGKDYVAKVKVDKVYPDMCSCYSLDEYQKDKIRQGDDAGTRVQ